MKSKNKFMTPMIIGIIAVLIVGYFIFLNNKNKDNTNDIVDENTPTYEILHRDMERNYPSTPKSVVSFYCDILKVIYKEDLNTKDYETIVGQLRATFDDELLAYNDYETYYLNLQAEIDTYKKNSMYVADYAVEDGYGIEYKTLKDGKYYAYVDVKIFIRSGKKIDTICEEFTLRKDENGRWHLLTWESVDASKMD